ncbi:MAG: hypothetical protein QGH42_07335 [Kiritimatiellia bacterium]|nr:hypothetical protein [Kiritimatiellia bacterium]
MMKLELLKELSRSMALVAAATAFTGAATSIPSVATPRKQTSAR